ncbi:MAG: hypothetical protein WCO94_00075 [Verrucomicrobiota bacterium]
MKIKNILAIAVVAALAPMAMADTTINITGATAFRAAALTALKNTFSGNLTYAYDGGTYTSSTYAILKGTYPGISGVTTIRTSFSGSVEGIRDVSLQNNVNFLPTSTATTSGGNGSQDVGTVVGAKPQLAFSDVFADSTPYNASLTEGANAGIIAFRFVASKGSSLTNITAQQFRALAGNGVQPLGLWTGNPADNSTTVYLSGRNDGSGTRVTTLAETGFGYANVVNQWKGVVSGSGNSTVVTSLQIWPTNDGANKSFIFNNDTAANGGYSSGGSLGGLLQGSTGNVTTKDATGTTIATGQNLVIIGYLGTNDSYNAVTNGAVALNYNGSQLNVNSSGITNPDVIRNGNYTFWAYEHLFWVAGSRTGDLDTLVTKLLGTDGLDNATNLGNAGIQISTMNVSRGDDGGLVGP